MSDLPLSLAPDGRAYVKSPTGEIELVPQDKLSSLPEGYVVGRIDSKRAAYEKEVAKEESEAAKTQPQDFSTPLDKLATYSRAASLETFAPWIGNTLVAGGVNLAHKAGLTSATGQDYRDVVRAQEEANPYSHGAGNIAGLALAHLANPAAALQKDVSLAGKAATALGGLSVPSLATKAGELGSEAVSKLGIEGPIKNFLADRAAKWGLEMGAYSAANKANQTSVAPDVDKQTLAEQLWHPVKEGGLAGAEGMLGGAIAGPALGSLVKGGGWLANKGKEALASTAEKIANNPTPAKGFSKWFMKQVYGSDKDLVKLGDTVIEDHGNTANVAKEQTLADQKVFQEAADQTHEAEKKLAIDVVSPRNRRPMLAEMVPAENAGIIYDNSTKAVQALDATVKNMEQYVKNPTELGRDVYDISNEYALKVARAKTPKEMYLAAANTTDRITELLKEEESKEHPQADFLRLLETQQETFSNFIKDPATWGEAVATADAKINAVIAAKMATRKAFQTAFFGRVSDQFMGDEADAGKIISFLTNPNNPNKQRAGMLLNKFMQDMRNEADVLKELGMGKGTHEKVYDSAIEGVQKMEQVLDRSTRRAQMLADLEAAKAKEGGSGRVMMLAYALSHVPGLGHGAAAATVALSAMKRPLHTLEALSKTDAIAGRYTQRLGARVQQALEGGLEGSKASADEIIGKKAGETQGQAFDRFANTLRAAAMMASSAKLNHVEDVKQVDPELGNAMQQHYVKTINNVVSKLPQRQNAPALIPSQDKPTYDPQAIKQFLDYYKVANDPNEYMAALSKGRKNANHEKAHRDNWPATHLATQVAGTKAMAGTKVPKIAPIITRQHLHSMLSPGGDVTPEQYQTTKAMQNTYAQVNNQPGRPHGQVEFAKNTRPQSETLEGKA